jgi:hypothetical protein
MARADGWRGREKEMDGQLEAHIALDDIYAAVQRVRDVVVAAETYCPEALHESLKSLMLDMVLAKIRLGGALQQLEEASIRADTERT